MCSSKPKVTVQEVAPAAAPVAAPTDTGNLTALDIEGAKRKRKATGKKKLMISQGTGTGVNV